MCVRVSDVGREGNFAKVSRDSELNLNRYGVASPCRTICTVCGSPPCPDLNLIHYISYTYLSNFSPVTR
ncbi:hypothetical protein AUP00_00005 [Neisseria gonorrhoeae]|nr:hypothetical protein AUP00_00005 [Neisseria gonorrhoeae]